MFTDEIARAQGLEIGLERARTSYSGMLVGSNRLGLRVSNCIEKRMGRGRDCFSAIQNMASGYIMAVYGLGGIIVAPDGSAG
jgi:hypothetical protein